jgi:tryptophan synthase alpha chain
MDGPVIQEASRRALVDGATPSSVLGSIKEAGLEVPVAVMTYANPVWHAGHAAFLAACVDAGVTGVIVPDLPVDEASDWTAACRGASVAPVFLAAPGTSDDRLRAIGDASRGFVYCVATYGVTGARDRLAETAAELVGRLRPLASRPLLVGVGIAEPSHAAVGSALVRPLLDGDTATALGLARAFRAATPS